ncbi:OsmC family protein [Lentilactobacillus diolivorans]|uniref:OsmC family protein n=1 Tax=Lentilactobacillus diolivorans TaxID=179838 RepID=UPI002469127B|nr:OsmC family protein [Lentilactobacillus diolivorans]MDH5106912.1 OsmC family protein [Lentilactobacillus diolivorans]
MAKYNVHTTLRNIGSQTISKTGVHQFIADEPTIFRGTDAGPNPVQYLLGSVGACLGASAASIVHRPSSNIKIKKFDVEVDGETERFPDKSSRVSKIHVTLDCETNLPPEENQKFIEETLHLCTVHNTLKDAVDFSFEIK